MLDAVAARLIPCSGDLLVFVAIYIDPSATDETAVRLASRAATLEGDSHRVRGAPTRTRVALVERRDTVTARSTAAADPTMQITAIELQRCTLPLQPPFYAAWDPDPRTRFDATIVRVHTDEGADRGRLRRHDGRALRQFEHLFVGRDPLRLDASTGGRSRRSRFTPGAIGRWRRRSGTSPGKALGVPVATLLGGAARLDRRLRLARRAAPCPSSAPRTHTRSSSWLPAVKVRIARDRVADGIAVVAAIRDAVGDALEIMVDLNQWWRMAGDIEPGLTPQGARGMIDGWPNTTCCGSRSRSPATIWRDADAARADRRADLRWRDGADLRRAAAARSTGDALDVLQPDVVLSLGIGGARTLAELALRANRWFTPHTWTNGIGLLANLHVCCGVGGGPFLEFPYDPPGWTPERRDFMLAEPIETDADGFVHVPTRRGSGSCSTRSGSATARWRDDRPALAD